MQSDKMAYSYRTDNIKHERDCRVLNYEEWMWYALVAQLRFTIFILYPAIRSPIQRNHVECRQWPTMISESVSLRSSFLLSAFLFIPFLLLSISFLSSFFSLIIIIILFGENFRRLNDLPYAVLILIFASSFFLSSSLAQLFVNLRPRVARRVR